MTNRTRVIAVAVALGALVLTSACSNPKPTPSTSATTPSTTTSTTTTSTPPLTPAQKDLKESQDLITKYWALLDGLESTPSRSLNEIATVARDQALAQWQLTISGDRAKQWKQIGSSQVVSASSTTRDGKTFSVVACIDVSKVNVVDKEGKSVVRAGRPDRQQYTYIVAKAPQGFFVTQDTLKGKPC